MNAESTRVVETPAWRLGVPVEVSERSPLMTVATIHPRGDQRVLRCAQTALDVGYRLHIIWVGEGDPARDPAVSETLLPRVRSTFDRLRLLPRLARMARETSASAGHIHDFYFLPFAQRWKRDAKIPILYDVHEFYPVYYAAKLPLPRAVTSWIEHGLARYETLAAKRLDAANVVAPQIALRFRAAGITTAVTPNYPAHRALPPLLPGADVGGAIHTGSLTPEYGSELLIDAAAELARRGSACAITAVERFPSDTARENFFARIDRCGSPANLRLIPPVPSHEIPELLAKYSIGLSVLLPGGQRDDAVPTKLYEYLQAGLVIIGTDLPAQSTFLENRSASLAVGPTALELADALEYAHDRDALKDEARRHAAQARESLTWHHVATQSLAPVLRSLKR